jgi:hypothetical protein
MLQAGRTGVEDGLSMGTEVFSYPTPRPCHIGAHIVANLTL